MIYPFHSTDLTESLPIALRLFGVSHLQPPVKRPDGVPYFQWFYCVQGQGELILNRQRFFIRPNQGFLIYPDDPHSYQPVTEDWMLHIFGFDGSLCNELLKTLQQQGIMIAVASNKYQAATRKLIAHYFPEINFVEVLGQREGIPAKPDPSIVNEIMTKAGVKQEDILYVGDSNVDMQTAHHAGVTAIGVAWGFRPRTELEALHPAHIIEKAEELLPLLLS